MPRAVLLLPALLAIAACSVQPFKAEPATATSSGTVEHRGSGAAPELRTPTEEVFPPGAEIAVDTLPPPTTVPEERPRRPPATLSPASRSLVTQAESQRRKGDFPGASVSLNRALRIEPNNPLLWIEMGRLRLDQGNFPQAENMGRKALAMSVGDDATQSAAWELIAQSLKARGRNAEAEEAMIRAREAAPQ